MQSGSLVFVLLLYPSLRPSFSTKITTLYHTLPYHQHIIPLFDSERIHTKQTPLCNTMPLAIPPELKKITSYVRRAEELDKDATNPESRLVAYYLRQYAVQQGIPLASDSSAAKTCLGNILEQLEKEKAVMDNFTKEEAAFLCRQFAQKVFDKADFEDREGTASKDTARTFYAAASFLQILEQFGPDETGEDRKRIVYAKWKATDILKALKEGRTPAPGGYGEEEPPVDDDDDTKEVKPKQTPVSEPAKEDAPVVAPVSDNDADEEILMPPPAPLGPPDIPPPAIPPLEKSPMDTPMDSGDAQDPPPPAYPGPQTGRSRPTASLDSASTPEPPSKPAPAPLPPPVQPVPAPAPAASGWFGRGGKGGTGTSQTSTSAASGKLSKAQWADATELTRFALAALEDRNADVAAERLQQALRTLGR